MTPELELAIEVALATGRPLLLRGDPGSGKSSLAAYVAAHRRWRFYEYVVTSRTQPTDLLWSFDSVRRLADAQARHMVRDQDYVEPGVLWWAMAPQSAERQGSRRFRDLGPTAGDPSGGRNEDRRSDAAVVLIDEIDKADPDVPNSLLVPLGSHEFRVTETGAVIRRESLVDQYLVVITTNDERELPQAFLRRCVTHTLDFPSRDLLLKIARAHLPRLGGRVGEHSELASKLADELDKARVNAKAAALRCPSTAEYLDALRACIALGIDAGGETEGHWPLIRDLVLLKPDRLEM